ncbi:hypothetical protein FDUTEX481_00437 [Tolypothrix sp. PCC 7601]|nr:hypothetical protein FDUTEX481_00437 [Tolypothrix sp. PCC 7601]
MSSIFCCPRSAELNYTNSNLNAINRSAEINITILKREQGKVKRKKPYPLTFPLSPFPYTIL